MTQHVTQEKAEWLNIKFLFLDCLPNQKFICTTNFLREFINMSGPTRNWTFLGINGWLAERWEPRKKLLTDWNDYNAPKPVRHKFPE